MKREQLIEAIFDTMQQVHRTATARLHSQIGRHEISLTQVELLLTIKHRQPISAKELAAHMRLTPGAIAQMLDHLAAQNYIGREPAEYDRRVSMVSLTPTGAERLHSLWNQKKATLRQIMESLSDEELAIMLKVQKKMLQHFETTPIPKK